MKTWTTKHYGINGCGLERWFLKTLINLSSDASGPVGADGQRPGQPSERLVRIAYELDSFKDGAGLYIVSRKGMLINQEDVVSFAPLMTSSSFVLGGTFTFRGFKFLLYLEPSGPPQPIVGVDIEGEDLEYCSLALHAGSIIEYWPERRKSQAIHFTWK